MIKIEFIESLDGTKSTLEDLREDYFAAVNCIKYGSVSPLSKLNAEIANTPSGVEQHVLQYCISNYRTVIIGKPVELEGIISHFDSNNWTDYIKGNKLFRDKLLDIFGYNGRFRLVKRKGVWFAHKLNIKACPYCNAQYTITTTEKGSPKKAKFQFDHFFNKSAYPQLSISMYNLVPSCAGCNLTKSGKMMNLTSHYHPYESSIIDKMQFRLDGESVLKSLMINKVRTVNIKTTCKSTSPVYDRLVKDHCSLYDIVGIYENHSDYAEEILLKALMYPESKKQELLEIEGLFQDKATFQRYLLGNYPNESDILKRPLAKFTQDIARQLKLIE